VAGALVAAALLLALVPAGPAAAVVTLTIRPITWNVVGLDSNKVSSGPDTFPVGARVCDTGDTAAAAVVSNIVWDTTNAFINLVGPSSLSLASLAPGVCSDFYYQIQVTRSSSAYNTTRRYHITAAATGVGAVSTPTPREIFVEHLVSQNRNSVTAITGPGGIGDPPPTTVYVGETYTYVLFSSTATGGYEQLETFLNLPDTIFQITAVSQTYTAPPNGTNDTVYADACGWQNDPTLANYRSCVGPPNFTGGKAGGDVVTHYTVKILAAGSANITALIYDFSGSSYHYNSDFGVGVNALAIAALPSADLSVSVSHSAPFVVGQQAAYSIGVSNLGPSDAAATLTITDPLPAGLTFVSGGGDGWTCSASGQNVTCTRATGLVSGASTTFPITVAVGSGAVPQVTDQATVSSPTHDPVASNNTAQDVTPIDRPPVAQNDSAATSKGVAVNAAVLANDSDPDGDALTVSVTTPPGHGTATVNPDKTIRYAPDAGFTGTDSFVYKICDPSGACSSATVSIQVPTVAGFERAAAFPAADGVHVAWATGFEAGNLGFDVYRGLGSGRTKLNASPLAGSALVVGPTTPISGERTYAFIDRHGGPASTYWVRDVQVSGRGTWHGPIGVAPRSPAWAANAPIAIPLGGPPPRGSAGTENGRTMAPRVATAPASRRTGSATGRRTSRSGGSAVKLLVDHEGWYRVPLETLAGLGLDTRQPNRLHVTAEGDEQAVEVAGDALEFYGLALDTASTDTRVYWVTNGRSDGARVVTIPGSGEGPPAGDSFPATVTRRDRVVYFASLRNGDADNFFGPLVSQTPITQTLDLAAVADPEGATLDVSVQGVTDGSHDFDVALNGVDVGHLAFEGQTVGAASFPVSNVVEGANDVTLAATMPGDDGLAGAISIDYERRYEASGDALRFTVPGGDRVTVTGFSDPDIRLLDVTDPAVAAEITPDVGQEGDGYTATATIAGDGLRTIYALAPAAMASPASVAADVPSALRAPSNAADLVIVTTGELASSVALLAELREGEGLRVDVVDVQDVYDEFAYGEKDPASIRDFLTLARATWRVPPRYVLLFGEGTYDPRGWLGGRPDMVPTWLLDTTLMETASDAWFADIDGDGIADIPVGRIPAATPADGAAVVAKLQAYAGVETGARSVLLAADQPDTFDFPTAVAQLGGLVPPGVQTTTLIRPDSGNADLLAAIDGQPTVVDYFGHGNVDSWAGAWLTSEDAASLENASHPALFVSMTCLNGYFIDPYLPSLGESLLDVPGGAIAVWGSTGLGDPGSELAVDEALIARLLGPAPAGGRGALRLGDALIRAQRAAPSGDVAVTGQLLGDPTTILR